MGLIENQNDGDEKKQSNLYKTLVCSIPKLNERNKYDLLKLVHIYHGDNGGWALKR